MVFFGENPDPTIYLDRTNKMARPQNEQRGETTMASEYGTLQMDFYSHLKLKVDLAALLNIILIYFAPY